MDKRLKRGLGRVVTGELFWDREYEKESFVEKIKEGANLLLVAQRRLGKTSLMKEAHDILNEGGFISLFVDVQKARSAADFVAVLSTKCQEYRSIWENIRGVFANVLGNIEEVSAGEIGVKIRGGVDAGNWMGKGDQVFEILGRIEKPVVLLLDEVPIMVNEMLKGSDFKITPERRKEADTFMSWLRAMSFQYQGQIRIVLAGSIGLEPVLRQAGLSATINNFMPFELKPWDEATAVGCIEALGREYGMEFEEGVPEEMYRKLGCGIPHHVQMFFDHVYDQCKKREVMKCTLEDIAGIYDRDMLGVRGHAELTHYEERLKLVLGEEQLPLALELLTEAAVTGCLSVEAIKELQGDYEFEGESVVEVEKNILWVLEHDGYLKQSKAGYVFVSKLLADWWQSRHGKFYTPVSERGE